MELLPAVALVVMSVAFAGTVLREQRRRKIAARRLATAVGHPSAGSRLATAQVLVEQLTQFGMVPHRMSSTVTAPGMDGLYFLHVLTDTIAVGYDTNSGRQFLGIAAGPMEATQIVARHAELPSPA